MAAKHMPDKNKDYITNKVLTVFSLCLLGVLGLMALGNLLSYSVHWQVGLTLVQVLRIVGVVILAMGVWFLLRERRMGTDTSTRLICGRTMIVLGVVLVVMFTLIYLYSMTAIKAFYVILPAFAFYYLIYHSYQPEFFLIAADCGLTAGLIGLSTNAMGAGREMLLLVGGVIVLAAQCFGVYRVQQAGGKLTLGRHKYAYRFSKNAYLMMYLTPAVMAVLLAVGLLMQGRVALGAMLAAGVYFFVTAVYYTVKLV